MNPHEFEFTINPGYRVCSADLGESKILICMIANRPENFEKRKLIRQTWSNHSFFPNVRIIFLTGLSNDSNVNLKLEQENQIYKDIVQENFIDTYRNLTLKTIMGYKWISNYCSKVAFVLKVDDDIVVNTPVLLDYLNELILKNKHTKNSYFGNHKENSLIYRDPNVRYYARYDEIAGEYFPLYHFGIGYLITGDLAAPFYEMSLETKFFYLEDVYSGLLAQKLQVNYVNIQDKYIENSEEAWKKVKKLKKKTEFIFSNTLELKDFKKIWNKFFRLYQGK